MESSKKETIEKLEYRWRKKDKSFVIEKYVDDTSSLYQQIQNIENSKRFETNFKSLERVELEEQLKAEKAKNKELMNGLESRKEDLKVEREKVLRVAEELEICRESNFDLLEEKGTLLNENSGLRKNISELKDANKKLSNFKDCVESVVNLVNE